MTDGREEDHTEAEIDELIEEEAKPLNDALDELEKSFGKMD